MESSNKITAFYCRSAVKNEESIKRQQEQLKNYADKHKITNYEFYIDNGFSGNSADRPSYSKMLSDIESAKISTIVAIDDGRFTRNLDMAQKLILICRQHKVKYCVLSKSYIKILMWRKNQPYPFLTSFWLKIFHRTLCSPYCNPNLISNCSS